MVLHVNMLTAVGSGTVEKGKPIQRLHRASPLPPDAVAMANLTGQSPLGDGDQDASFLLNNAVLIRNNGQDPRLPSVLELKVGAVESLKQEWPTIAGMHVQVHAMACQLYCTADLL